jgi:hypothetical protein
MHRKGYIHRDLKPDNVVVRTDGRPCLLDMGVAFAEPDRFTQEGIIAGTLNYMPPEGLLGMVSQLDGRSDIWSLGALLYEMLSGQLLQQISNREEALVASVALNVDPPTFPESTPEAVRRICRKCLAREPNERFNTAADVASALRQWLAATMPIEKMPEDVRLLGWRLGMKLGSAVENHAFFGRQLHHLGDISPEAETVSGEAASHMAYALAHGMGLVSNLDELATLARNLSIELPKLPGAHRLQEMFYYKDRSADGVRWLRSQTPEIRDHLEALYRLVMADLRKHGDPETACCEVAARATLLLLSREDPKDLDGVWLGTGMPRTFWEQFKDAIYETEDGKQALIQLDKRVQRFLLFGDEGQGA